MLFVFLYSWHQNLANYIEVIVANMPGRILLLGLYEHSMFMFRITKLTVKWELYKI